MPEQIAAAQFSWRPKLTQDWLSRWDELDRRIRLLDGTSAASEFAASSIEARQLAGHELGPRENLKMERLARRMLAQHERFAGLRHFRLAVISNRTVSHLIAPLAAAGLVRGLLVEAVEVPYESVLRLAFDREKGGENESRGVGNLVPADAAVIILDEGAFRGPDAPLDHAREEQALGEIGRAHV